MRQAQATVRSSRHVGVGTGAVCSGSSYNSEEEIIEAKRLEDASHRSRGGRPRLVEGVGGGGGVAATALYGPGNKYRLGVREPWRMTAKLRARERAQADKVSERSEKMTKNQTRVRIFFNFQFFFPRPRRISVQDVGRSQHG